MPPQSHDAAIVSELFNQNDIDTLHSSIVYDDNGHLIKLALFSAASPIRFPASFGQLANLRELYIYDELASFPHEICQLTNLQVLIISNGCKDHNIPSEIAQLSNLQYLGLSNSGLMQLPDALWELHNLQTLDLSRSVLSVYGRMILFSSAIHPRLELTIQV